MACSHSLRPVYTCWVPLLLLSAAYCQSNSPHQAVAEGQTSRQITFQSLVQPNLRGLVDQFVRSVTSSRSSSQNHIRPADTAAPAVAPAPTGGPSRAPATQSDSSTISATSAEWVPIVAVNQVAQPPRTAPAPGASQASSSTRPGLVSHFQEVARWAGLDVVFASEILQGSEDLSPDQLQQQQLLLPEQLPGARREGLTWVHGGQSNPDDEDVHPDSNALGSSADTESFAAARAFPDELEETESLGSTHQEDVRFWPLVSEEVVKQAEMHADLTVVGDLDERPMDSEEPRLWTFNPTADSAKFQGAPWQLEAGSLTGDTSEQPVDASILLQPVGDAEKFSVTQPQSLRSAASTASSSSSSSSSSRVPGQFDPRLIATRGQDQGHQQDAHGRPLGVFAELLEDAEVAASAEEEDESWPWVSETAAIPRQQQPQDDSGSWNWIGKGGEDAIWVELEFPGRAQALLTRALAGLSRPFTRTPARQPPAADLDQTMRPSLQEVAAEQSGELFVALEDDQAGYVSTVAAQDMLADLRDEMLREVMLERLRLRQLQQQAGERLARQARVEADAGPVGWTWPTLPSREASLSDCMDMLLGTRQPAVQLAVQLKQPARRLLAGTTGSTSHHKQALERQSVGSGTGSKSSDHGASSGSRSGEAGSKSGDSASSSAARSADKAGAGKLQSEPHAVPATKQALQSSGQQRTPKATASSKAGVQQDSYEIFPGSKIVQETPMVEEDTTSGKMRAAGISAAEANVQGSSKFASKPKGLLHGGKHSSSSSNPLTASSTTSGLEKPTAAQEEASNEGSDWMSATLPVRKDEARTYQSELNDKADK